jgi:hypothetical protein
LLEQYSQSSSLTLSPRCGVPTKPKSDEPERACTRLLSIPVRPQNQIGLPEHF